MADDERPADPADRASSETEADRARLAAFCFLREFWTDEVAPWLEGLAEVDALLEGIIPSLEQRRALGPFIAGRLYETIFNVLYRLDGEGKDYQAAGYVGWRLMELDAEGELTGREVGDLHESLGECIPDGGFERLLM